MICAIFSRLQVAFKSCLTKYTSLNGNEPADFVSALRCIQPERVDARMTVDGNFRPNQDICGA